MWLVVSSPHGEGETDVPRLSPWLLFPGPLNILYAVLPQEDRPQSRDTWRLQDKAPVLEPISSRHSNGGHIQRASDCIFHGHDPVTGE